MQELQKRLARVASLSAQSLRIEWRKEFRQEPPPGLKRSMLIRAITYRMQERSLGGLSQAAKSTLRKLAHEAVVEGSARSLSPAPSLTPGTRLVRDWGGQAHAVLVLENGFEYQGQRYRSLTEIARRITTAHWSGPRFFGLTRAGVGDTTRGRRAGGNVAAGAHEEV